MTVPVLSASAANALCADVPDSVYPDLHAVVFDVNVYLDVASLVGPPFTWDKFQDAAARNADAPLPNHADRRVDSLRAVSACLEGRFAGPERIEVWSSEHIDSLVVRKASQPQNASTPELSGLGWAQTEAESLLVDLVDDLVYEKTEGGSATYVGVDGRPPLDHEDACVFTTALHAAGDAIPPSIKYCVTRDEQFRTATGLNSNVLVLYPDEFVSIVRRSRAALAMSAMRRTT